MEFRFTAEQDAFRTELRDFFKEVLPSNWSGPSGIPGDVEDHPLGDTIRKKMGERRWLTLSWPEEFGGLGASRVDQVIFNEEVTYHQVPGVNWSAVRNLGPALMLFGSEEQRRRHLPPIARGEKIWVQCSSEPGAGSDLAGLTTKAVRDGDDFILTGSKIWQSIAHKADWFYVLARTDPDAPKHRGISVFLVESSSPGVSVRPVINMANIHSFNEVVFDDVRVSSDALLGELNRGWYIAMAWLDFERSGIEWSAGARRLLDNLRTYCRNTRRNGTLLSDDPKIRHALAAHAVELETCRLLAYRVAGLQQEGQSPNREAAVSKLLGTEATKRLANTAMKIVGLHGTLDADDERAPLAGEVARTYLCGFAATIAGGTSEIQRNIIALRGLGLPR